MVNWVDPQPVKVPDAVRQVVPATDSLQSLVGELLVRRGIADANVARGFLDPRAYTPAAANELPDVRLAAGRLQRAIEQGERIAVWGDFDVDGQTATALYVEALGSLGADVRFTIPTRRESHGVHPTGVQRLIDRGVQLILTADTGVAAHQAIDLARSCGVHVLVTDHHDLPEALPQPLALVNPKRLPADSPLYELPGVGVAYEVVLALLDCVARAGRGGSFEPDRLLDLVALGIVADVATLRADVRYLLQRGLEVLRHTKRIGLVEMMRLARLDPGRLTEEDIAFAFAPRLNALSRVGQDLPAGSAALAGVELLTTDDPVRARTIATALEAVNARRRWLTKETMDAVLTRLERDRALLEGPAIVVAGATWDAGIVGIVAGRLAERFNKPAVVFSAPPGEMVRGSARSVKGVDIHAAIAAQRDLLYRCGGHPMAAGLSMDGEQLHRFRRALWRTLEQTALPPIEREVAIDAYLSLDQISIDLPRALAPLSPFGPGNERPVFATRDLAVASSQVIGRTREHRRLVICDADQRQEKVLWWRSADESVPQGTFDLAYTVGISAFGGTEDVQLTWVAARLTEPIPVEVAPAPAIAVCDHRRLLEPEPVLRALSAPTGGVGTIVWGEATAVAGVSLHDRNLLERGETLVIWTTPPGPAELRDALGIVAPSKVIFFGIDPGLDTLHAFLTRLAGLVKHALGTYGGQVSLSRLAGAMAHSEWTVRLGLEWMAQRGQIAVAYAQGGEVTLRQGQGDVGDELLLRQGQLAAQLAEAAAYRAYFGRADAERLLRA